MSDPTLLTLGCAVSFIAAAGAYVALRERFTSADLPAREEPRPEPIEELREVA